VLALAACDSARKVTSSPAGTAPPARTHDAAGSAAPDCESSKRGIDATLSRSTTCRVDEDCRLISLPCPFGCARAVHRSLEVEPLLNTIHEFKQACNACLYRCRNVDGRALCRDGICRLPAP
jgi:hypothetical protein